MVFTHKTKLSLNELYFNALKYKRYFMCTTTSVSESDDTDSETHSVESKHPDHNL